MELTEYIINIDATIIDVMKKIDTSTSKTVFAVNRDGEVVGSITDGDIRRGLIKGFSVNDKIVKFTFKDFSYLKEGENNYNKLKEFRDRKLKVVPFLTIDGKLKKVYNFSITKSILPIDAVIMAGGKGTRLKPLTNTIPKPLLKIANKEIISYNFDRLNQYGINNQFITVNYLGEQIEDYCNTYNSDINFKIVREKDFLGTAGSLSLIDNFSNNTVLIMNSDLLTNIDYEDFYKSFVENNADMMVASIPYDINLPYAIFDTDDKRICSFKEKPSYTYYANAGLYLIKKELINRIPKDSFYDATDLMENIISNKLNLLHYPIRSYWLDIGKHNDFEKAQKDVAHINWD